MEYDANLHQNVVNNLRRGFVARYGYPLSIVDADVWRIYEALQSEEDCDSL